MAEEIVTQICSTLCLFSGVFVILNVYFQDIFGHILAVGPVITNFSTRDQQQSHMISETLERDLL
jgi:hypothetical protein